MCKSIITSVWCKVLFTINLFMLVHTQNVTLTDFLATNVLPDGEIEIRIRYRGISAKETTVSSRSDTRITLRQLTDGKHFIQLIYDEFDNIRDCEYLHQKGQIESFLTKFQNDLDNLSPTSNNTLEMLDSKSLPKHINRWFNYRRLQKQCKRSHRFMKKILNENRDKNKTESEYKRSRKSRAVKDYLIAPGTLWCGYDHIANSYTNLGGMSLTDKCCRKHDHCKMNIHGFTKKYNYYNVKPFTLSHCWCDNSFRACLKMADTSDANLVGKLFFNVVQTKCFVLKPKKVCMRRSWWGKCTKKKYTKQAILRDNLSY